VQANSIQILTKNLTCPVHAPFVRKLSMYFVQMWDVGDNEDEWVQKCFQCKPSCSCVDDEDNEVEIIDDESYIDNS